MTTYSSGGGDWGGNDGYSAVVPEGFGETGSPFGYNLPWYGEGDVFVGRPTLAVVGDRPGGEWIGGLDQAAARFGGRGGQGISISAPLNINAPVYGVDDLNAILAAHSENIVREVKAEMAQDQWW